jgi:hypothetical protein
LRISFEARETSKVPNRTTGVCRNDSIAFRPRAADILA